MFIANIAEKTCSEGNRIIRFKVSITVKSDRFKV